MRILVFTDLHGNLKALDRITKTVKRERVELLLCLGDLTIFEHDLDNLLLRLSRIGVRTLLIHGNHEAAESMARKCRRHANLEFIHGSAVRIGNWTFVGYGGGGFSERYPELERLSREWKGLDWEHTVVLSHAPPHATKLDNVGDEEDPWHVGSKTLTTIIKRYKPAYVFAGHIHECFTAKDRIGPTVIENPGPTGSVHLLKP